MVQIHHGQPHGCVTERFKVLVLKISERKLRGFKSYRSRQYPQCMRHVSPLFGCGWKQPYLPESSNGRTSVFQTECVGSIPTFGSNKGWQRNNLFWTESFEKSKLRPLKRTDKNRLVSGVHLQFPFFVKLLMLYKCPAYLCLS